MQDIRCTRRPAIAVILVSLVTFGAHASGAPTISLQFTGAAPQPNYPETTDANDLSQLVDGQLGRHPFWAARGAVGWVNRTPVTLTGSADLRRDARYELQIRTAMESSADVFPPRRIDIYCRSGQGALWRHSGALGNDGMAGRDGEVVDLRVPFVACGGSQFQVVIQSAGPYIMIDEMSIVPAVGAPVARSSVEVADPAADARGLLEAALTEVAWARLTDRIRQQGGGSSLAWLSLPWSDLQGPPRNPVGGPLRLTLASQDDVAYVVGIANPGAQSRTYSVRIQSDSGGPSFVKPLLPVLAANGNLAFDAIGEPKTSGHTVPAGVLRYVLITEPAGAPGGLRQITVVDDVGWRQELEVYVDLLDQVSPTSADRPRVIVWTYTNDKPVWRDDNSQVLADELAAAGVNVFDIHPAHIPMPLQEEGWNARAELLRGDLRLFRQKGLVLLFLGDSAWDRLASAPRDPDTQRRLSMWTAYLKAVMSDGGFTSNDWALYPIDEPRGANLGRLATVIARLREVDPSLRFYANPTVDRGQAVLALPALWRLKGLVDYWQPMAGDAFEAAAKVIGTGNAALWVYENPRRPARAESPACYRAAGSRAFGVGARGMGFWSFSSTNGSSAWTDFDGDQPDWATAYESAPGSGRPFVSSRRWEAFKQGVRDFKAMTFCARMVHGASSLGKQCDAYRRAVDVDIRQNCAS